MVHRARFKALVLAIACCRTCDSLCDAECYPGVYRSQTCTTVVVSPRRNYLRDKCLNLRHLSQAAPVAAVALLASPRPNPTPGQPPTVGKPPRPAERCRADRRRAGRWPRGVPGAEGE